MLGGMKSLTQTMLFGALCLGLMGTACSTNEGATKKCKKSKDCATCCSDNGASGHATSTVNGKTTCKCLGG